MSHTKEYYENWLLHLETERLELIGLLLKVELTLYEIQKFLHLAKESKEFGSYIYSNLILSQISLKKNIKQYQRELEEIELDITHCQFMIERLNNLDNDFSRTE